MLMVDGKVKVDAGDSRSSAVSIIAYMLCILRVLGSVDMDDDRELWHTLRTSRHGGGGARGVTFLRTSRVNEGSDDDEDVPSWFFTLQCSFACLASASSRVVSH